MWPPGQEKAIGGQTGGKPYPNGQELAGNGNGGLAVSQAPGKELAK